MARRKKPDGETAEQQKARLALETISNTSTRSEKMSWDRKMDSMVKLLATLRPIEDQIIELMAKKQPIFDAIADLRSEMTYNCVHPITHLVVKPSDDGEYIECKFCLKRFSIPNG